VYPQPGRGGGWSLVGGARTDLTGLTAGEAQALFLLAGPASAGAPAVRSALRKLVRALPGPFRADAEAAAGAVHVDPAAWSGHAPDRPELVDLLQNAVVRRRKVRLGYAGRTRERTDRVVDPWGLVEKADVWYLLAGTGEGHRTFRVDRIVEAVVTDLDAERPADLDLAEAWQKVVDVVERRRSLTAVTVVVDDRFVPVLRNQFGRHCTAIAALEGDRSRVRLAAPTALDVARHLAGWGGLLEVEPGHDGAAVRAVLARLARELADRYEE
jgi:predicted DNA-binding transcriptional regulator YafY